MFLFKSPKKAPFIGLLAHIRNGFGSRAAGPASWENLMLWVIHRFWHMLCLGGSGLGCYVLIMELITPT